MLQPREVHVAPRDLSRYRSLITPERFDELISGAASARALLRSRTVWNVNSTALGGGVAEMLRVIVGYATGAGIDARWLVIDGDPDFFKITKRIHNRLHGFQGDDGDLGPSEASHFERISHENDRALTRILRPGDVALLHDPQTVGLAPALSERGVIVVWRCHVGSDTTNRWSDEAWEFLRPFLESTREIGLLACDLCAGMGRTQQGDGDHAVNRSLFAEEQAHDVPICAAAPVQARLAARSVD